MTSRCPSGFEERHAMSARGAEYRVARNTADDREHGERKRVPEERVDH
jgi:hypothetical protein